MHPADAIALRLRPLGWAAIGAATLGIGALAVIAADGRALDLLAGSLSGVGCVAALGLAERARRAASLPLEIGDLALRGEVDAVPVLRFRARLGLGRAFRDPSARVWVLGDGGERELPVTVPAGRFVGALTVVAQDPDRRVGEGARVRIALRVTSGDRAWDAVREIAAPTRRGWFDAGKWDGVLEA